jgi:alpha-1,3-rhamnosyl/mannosyltransferase
VSSLPEVTAGAAHLVPPDLDAWSDALTRLLLDDSYRTSRVDRGRIRADELTWERCARATHDVYEEALGL